MTGMRRLLAEKRRIIDKKIDETLLSDFEQREANEVIKYAFRTGGKRIRPILLLFANEAVDGNEDEAVDAAVAVELIHAASLIFDDLIDKDSLRRSYPTIPIMFDDDRAISSALFLASKGVQILSNYKNSQIMRMIGIALVDISKGEVLDVLGSALSIEQYVAIAQLKTASLFGASSGIGGIVGGGTASEIEALYNYGRLVGVAFQIRDDIIDLTKDKKTAGLERSNIVSAHYTHESSRMRKLVEIARKYKKTDEREEDVIESIKKKAIGAASSLAKEHMDRAKQQLRVLDATRPASILNKFADYVFFRKD